MSSYKELKLKCIDRGIILPSRSRKKVLLNLLDCKTLVIGISPKQIGVKGLYTLTKEETLSWTSFIIKKSIPQKFFNDVYLSNTDLLEDEQRDIQPQIFNSIMESLSDNGNFYLSRYSESFMKKLIYNNFHYSGHKDISNMPFLVYRKTREIGEVTRNIYDYKLIDCDLNLSCKPIKITYNDFLNEMKRGTFLRKLWLSIKSFFNYKIDFYQEKYHDMENKMLSTKKKVDNFRSQGMDNSTIKDKYPMYDFYMGFLYDLNELITMIKLKVSTITLTNVRNNLIEAIYDTDKGLESLIGRENIKEQIVSQLYAFSENWKVFSGFFNNFALFGTSGIGKTKIGQVIAFVYSKCGILATEKVYIVSRSDLVGQYIGHTAPRTRSLLLESLEGVLFIDEAYQLANPDSPKDFGNESITEIVNFLDKYIGMNIVTVAGYKDLMKKNFFGSNEGLERRFPFQLSLEPYSKSQLTRILISFLEKSLEISLSRDFENLLFTILTKCMETYPKAFEKQAGDILNLGGSLITAIHSSYKVKWSPTNVEKSMPIVLGGVKNFLEMKGYTI